ncbi:G-protein coupled receptor family C group 6 member A-like [Scomber scombrus]|uniref:G-protein coupled receptor family C group 6 member A n=2 Tax=Scomber scombrus TaxID=13677 RepID=A0AAV1NVF4_SCOSC
MFWFKLFFVMSIFCLCSGENVFLHAYSPGDIIIGGLFPIHLNTNRTTTPGPISCTAYDIKIFLHTQVLIYAIREINRGTPRALPNITIGYDIYDTCGDVTLAIRATLKLLENQSHPQSCLMPVNIQSALPEPRTKVVIGERFSEVSIAVARVVALSSVAQISHASTSELLSKKLKFPTFLRTVSSDEYQTKAIAELVKKFNWKTVAIIGSDDEYGKYGSDRLRDNLIKMKDICIEFIDILPGYFSKNTPQAIKKLENMVSKLKNSSAEAIVLFTKASNVAIIIKKAIQYNIKRTWIASDTWSTSSKISAMRDIEKAGQVFGFIFKKNEVPGFKDYVMSMFSGTTNTILEHYLTKYPFCSGQSKDNNLFTNCQRGSKRCLDPSCLASYIDQDESYSLYLAVQVIVEGLRRLLKCNNQQCQRSAKFTASELLMEIRRVNFTVDTTHIFFDSHGDPSLGYDIVYWNMTQSMQPMRIETIGEYWPNGKIHVPDDLVKKMRTEMESAYHCSKKCKPGQELKKQDGRCCYRCVSCLEGDFSLGDRGECKPCSTDQYSSQERNKCLNKTIVFLAWKDPFTVILSSFAVLGIIITVAFAVLFTIYRSTPVVKAVGGYLCFLELFSLLACFCLTFSFIGKPTKASCMLGLPLFGIAFSLCISCILANLLQILVGFSFDLEIGSWLKRLNQPVALVAIISGIQLALCVPWLYFNHPYPKEERAIKTILLHCHKGSIAFFIAMLCYNALLAFICFLFAFKGKQLPDLYKNASLITISMLLFLIIWIVFTPVYISSIGKYEQAIEIAAILISTYSILVCHLAPKCYIMVFKKEINNENAITEYIRKHYEQKGISVVKS